ncbi:MAG: hypothetical protein GY820_08385 [Gammaproteobacteria bacterium]|nr:hypothetical protein [Gammaproteobacteria bacterium]
MGNGVNGQRGKWERGNWERSNWERGNWERGKWEHAKPALKENAPSDRQVIRIF